MEKDEFKNKIILGDNLEILKKIPDKSIDLVFADPPYNLQLKNDLYRPNQTKVDGVFDNWDQFASFEEYDNYTFEWLKECKRVLKDNGTLWVIGSYHNIYRIGKILQDLNFWILNDVVWIKTNPMPNFKGTRFTNAHETLLWVAKEQNSKYTFHYKSMKSFNDDTQMRSDWLIPICSGKERIKDKNNLKAHSTQKPFELLLRIIIATTNVGDTVLDPFMGSGTTAAVSKRLKRNFIGIEKEAKYVEIANKRLVNIVPLEDGLLNYNIEKRPPKVPFGFLIEKGLIQIGEYLYDDKRLNTAKVLANGSLENNLGEANSIHKMAATLMQKQSYNGWNYWNIERNGSLISINELRKKYINTFLK